MKNRKDGLDYDLITKHNTPDKLIRKFGLIFRNKLSKAIKQVNERIDAESSMMQKALLIEHRRILGEVSNAMDLTINQMYMDEQKWKQANGIPVYPRRMSRADRKKFLKEQEQNHVG